MAYCMEFPDDWHDFLKSNQFIDSKEVYTNGSELIQVYRVEQLIEHLLKEQEAVKPKYNARTNWYECGACHYSMTSGMHCRSELIPATKVRYCANCGFPVNWEDR